MYINSFNIIYLSIVCQVWSIPFNIGETLKAEIYPVLENCPINDCMKNIGMTQRISVAVYGSNMITVK